jgi:hypothetical protein
MKIIYDEKDFLAEASVAALGMFDGVHIGHQALIRRAVALAHELNGESVVCTFDRHPLSVLCPEKAPVPLLSLEGNLQKFDALGADWALVQAFTPEYGATPPEDFLRRLVSDYRVRAIVAGENYTFGAGGRGDAALIRAMAGALGYRAEIVPPVMDGDRFTVTGEAPVAVFSRYNDDYLATTHGRGQLQYRLDHYAPCRDADAIVEAANYNPLADDTPDSVFCSHGAGYTVPWNEVRSHAHCPVEEK